MAQLYERDAGRCGICTGPVLLEHVGPLGPSMDHIMPVAHGGSNADDNLQLAHHACNTRKQDRVGFTCEPISEDGAIALTQQLRLEF